jgi:hypothetical protein
MATLDSIVASAKAECDQTGSDQGGTNAELLTWAVEDYSIVQQRLATIAPSRFAAVTTATIPGGTNFVNVPAVGSYGTIRQVSRLSPGTSLYLTIPRVDDQLAFDSQVIAWNQGRTISTTSLNVWPPDQAPGDYLIGYTPMHVASTGTPSVALDLIPGGEKICAQMLCCHIRRRLDQDVSPHLDEIERLYKHFEKTLAQKLATPQSVSDFIVDSGY